MEWLFQLFEAPLIWLSQQCPRRKGRRKYLPSSAIGHSLGEADFGEPVALTDPDLARHLYVLGSTGSGKTNFIMKLLERDLENGHNVIVLDLRGDLVERALALCAAQDVPPERVSLLDLREKERIVGFNPLGGKSEPFVRALHLLDVVRSESESWGVQLEETFRCALLALAKNGKWLTDLDRVLSDPHFASSLTDEKDGALRSFFDKFGSLTSQQRLAWSMPVTNKVAPLLATPSLRAMFGSPESLPVEELLNRKGGVILVSLAADELHGSARMVGALLVGAICRAMLSRVGTPENKRSPVRLYVDEFESMATGAFESIVAEGRRFGLSLVLSHQNFSQLPAKLRSVIRNNVGLRAYFSCGFQDAKDVAAELGCEPCDVTGQEPGQMLLAGGGHVRRVQVALSNARVNPMDSGPFRDRVLEATSLTVAEVESAMALREGNVRAKSINAPWSMGEEE